jgi:type I restriction enzyme, S subunit
MVKKLSAAQRRYIENALLIAALGLAFEKLEKDYASKSLGDIAETTSGGTPLRNMSLYYGGNIPWIKSGELNDKLIEEAEEYISEEGLANSSAKIYPKGTLVVALYGATVGKTGILGFDAASNQAVCAIFPKTQQITNEYIYWFLRHKRPEFLSSSFGGAQPNISQKIIRETQIPIPPLDLQEKLSEFFTVVEKRQNGDTSKKYPMLPDEFSNIASKVTIIESLAARVHEAQRLREEAEKELKLLERSTLNSIFVAKENLPEGWHWKRPIEFCEAVECGSTPEAGLMHSGDGEVPFIKVYNLTFDGKLDFSIKPTFVSQETHNTRLKRSKVYPGDVLTNIVGPPLGKVSIIPDKYPEWNTNQAVVIFRTGKDVDNKFLAYILQAPNYQTRIRSTIKGTAGQDNISLSTCRNTPMPIPPLDEQRRIVAYLDGLQAKVNALRELQAESGKELSALMPSILDKAFKGELLVQKGKLYFAYGSNMKIDRITATERAPSARKLCRAKLLDKKLVFNKISTDGSGKGNIIDFPSNLVWGVLFEINEREIQNLDRAEKGYDKQDITVIDESGNPVDAFTYISSRTNDDLKPYDWYLQLIIKGADENDLPKEYIDDLRKIASTPDRTKKQ